MDDFGGLIRSLMNDSLEVVKGILDAELIANKEHINTTKEQISATSLDLIEFTQNESEASQSDLEDLVSSFSPFIQSRIEKLIFLAISYASQIRLEAASQVQSSFNGHVQERILAMKRTAYLFEAGLMDFHHAPDRNITAKDCSLLAMICEASDELNTEGAIYTGLATESIFSCSVKESAQLVLSTSNATHLTQGVFIWAAYTSDVPEAQRKSWWERCMTETPPYITFGVCPLPQDCNCGYRPTCQSWYQIHVNASGMPAPRMTDMNINEFTHMPLVSLTYPVYNSSLQPRQLLAVAGAEFYFQRIRSFLDGLSGAKLMYTAVVLNDTTLTTMAYSTGTPENYSNTNFSLLTNPHEPFRTIGTWLKKRRISLVNRTQAVLTSIYWDIFPSQLDSTSYFVLVGMTLRVVFGTILESEAAVLQDIQTLKWAHMAKLNASEIRTRNHLMATRIANLEQLEEMKVAMEEEIMKFRNTSETALGASEGEGRVLLEQLLAAQRQAVHDMLVLHLSVLTFTIGWSVAVVIAMFLTTLVAGVYGTLSITKGLQFIIRLMEDVAQMRVEALAVPKNSKVTEVQRIQFALDKLVGRLALYKGFLPAGLFPDRPPLESTAAGPQGRPPDPTTSRKASQRGSAFSNIFPTKQETPIESMESIGLEQSMLSNTQTRITKRNVVAMVLNIVSFQDVLYGPAMSEGPMEVLLNQYLSLVHKVVAEARGNIDVTVGDQLLVTFNAHMCCSDAPSVAARTALELQTLLANKMRERLQLQIGLAEGWTYIGCAGCDAFKALVALGSPLKVASMLSHLSTASETAVLADPAMEERLRYTYRLRPVALVCLPYLGKSLPTLARNVPIYLLEGAKDLQPNEWMYEISPGVSLDDWAGVFQRLRTANSPAQASELLEGYLSHHPADVHAQLMKSHMGLWRPKAGVPLCERPDSGHCRLTSQPPTTPGHLDEPNEGPDPQCPRPVASRLHHGLFS
eukprot:GGOE01004296.1.p1 GENE.GGOE01004296.1~~GGOE01004296.1.p1  ORF type:complete len:1026 (+),score=257.57 GGOE01004296.1:165-3080(+)